MSKQRAACLTVSVADIKASILKVDSSMKTAEALEQLEKRFGSRPLLICGETRGRALSKYQEFMSGCMKGGVPLVQCVEKWREQKKNV